MATSERSKARYAERREQGLCVDCCAPVDQLGKFVRCKACRDYHTEALRQWRKKHPKPVLTLKEQALKEKAKKEAALQMIAFEKRKRQKNKCMHCEWGSITGSKVLCPFPEGGCMKR